MLPTSKIQVTAALKRLRGLLQKVETMVQEDTYCPEVLEQILAMHGHLRHIQGIVLESHLHTCARKKLSPKTQHDAFVKELTHAIGLSKRS